MGKFDPWGIAGSDLDLWPNEERFDGVVTRELAKARVQRRIGVAVWWALSVWRLGIGTAKSIRDMGVWCVSAVPEFRIAARSGQAALVRVWSEFRKCL